MKQRLFPLIIAVLLLTGVHFQAASAMPSSAYDAGASAVLFVENGGQFNAAARFHLHCLSLLIRNSNHARSRN